MALVGRVCLRNGERSWLNRRPGMFSYRLNAEIGKAIVAPQVSTRLEALGYEVTGSTPSNLPRS